jgi:hypothetical protein
MNKRIILLSLCISVAVGGIIFCIILALDSYGPDQQQSEYELPPKKGEIVDDVEIEGAWLSWGCFEGQPSFEYTSIEFKKISTGNYSVEFCSGGCLSDSKLNRQATYENGVITLNEQVEEYASLPYTKMYTIRFNDQIYLIASESIKRFESDDDMDYYEMYLLKKKTENSIKDI